MKRSPGFTVVVISLSSPPRKDPTRVYPLESLSVAIHSFDEPSVGYNNARAATVVRNFRVIVRQRYMSLLFASSAEQYPVALREIAFDVRLRFRNRVGVSAGKDSRDPFSHLDWLSAEKFRESFVADDVK